MTTLKYKNFQREDFARAALHDGLVLGLDTGLGKSIAAYTWPMLKVGWKTRDGYIEPLAPVLIVAPGDLHEQLIREGLQKMRIRAMRLESQEQFLDLRAGSPYLPPGFYITSYTELTGNGVRRMPNPDKEDPRELMRDWALKDTHPDDDTPPGPNQWLSPRQMFQHRTAVWGKAYRALAVGPDSTLAEVDAAFAEAIKTATTLHQSIRERATREATDAHRCLRHLACQRRSPTYEDLSETQKDFVRREFLRRVLERFSREDGMEQNGIICAWSPALADLCRDAFACVVLDEAVKIKSEASRVSAGVRKLRPRFRLALTATPIKNRLPDIFRLAWWAAGAQPEAHARFPYADSPAEREAFASTFLVSEQNLTREAKKLAAETGIGLREAERRARRSRSPRFTRVTAEICNIHRLWKLLSPIVLRRRKDECGEAIVGRERIVVHCAMGSEQARVYQYHLKASYLDKNGEPAPGAKLQALRIAAVDPSSSMLTSVGCVAGLPHRSNHRLVPKYLAVLSVVKDLLQQGEQVLIGSPFNESQDKMGELLAEAGVPFIIADGRTNPRKRGPLLQRFRDGHWPVCLAGVESVANGHNLDTVSNVILYGYSWSYDLIKQFLDRVHRLTSTKPVKVFVVLCDASIDRRLEALQWEKSDSVELALDGHLIRESSTEVTLSDLLSGAAKDFDPKAKTIPEEQLDAEWAAIKRDLAAAASRWSEARRKPAQNTEPSDTMKTLEIKHNNVADRWIAQLRGQEWAVYHITGDNKDIERIGVFTSEAEAVAHAKQQAARLAHNPIHDRWRALAKRLRGAGA